MNEWPYTDITYRFHENVNHSNSRLQITRRTLHKL